MSENYEDEIRFRGFFSYIRKGNPENEYETCVSFSFSYYISKGLTSALLHWLDAKTDWLILDIASPVVL